jgi:hypothetical protein
MSGGPQESKTTYKFGAGLFQVSIVSLQLCVLSLQLFDFPRQFVALFFRNLKYFVIHLDEWNLN